MSSVSPLSSPLPWDLVSSAYADEVVPMFERYATEALRLANALTGARIVDVACGPGTLAMLAAQRGHLVDAIDFSPAMIERFEARRLTLGLDNVIAKVGDGQARVRTPLVPIGVQVPRETSIDRRTHGRAHRGAGCSGLISCPRP